MSLLANIDRTSTAYQQTSANIDSLSIHTFEIRFFLHALSKVSHNSLFTMIFSYFSPTIRHSFQTMCRVFVPQDFFRFFDGLWTFSSRRMSEVSEPKCLFGVHASQHLQWLIVHCLATTNRTQNLLRETNNSLRGTQNVFRDTNNFLRETRYVFRDTNNSLRGTQNVYDYLQVIHAISVVNHFIACYEII